MSDSNDYYKIPVRRQEEPKAKDKLVKHFHEFNGSWLDYKRYLSDHGILNPTISGSL